MQEKFGVRLVFQNGLETIEGSFDFEHFHVLLVLLQTLFFDVHQFLPGFLA